MIGPQKRTTRAAATPARRSIPTSQHRIPNTAQRRAPDISISRNGTWSTAYAEIQTYGFNRAVSRPRHRTDVAEEIRRFEAEGMKVVKSPSSGGLGA